jgi:hypothetical protein
LDILYKVEGRERGAASHRPQVTVNKVRRVATEIIIMPGRKYFLIVQRDHLDKQGLS